MRHKIYEESASQLSRPSQLFQLGIINETPAYSEAGSHFVCGILEWRYQRPYGGQN